MARITIASKLKFSQQCNEAASKDNRILGFVYRNFCTENKSATLPLCKSLVRPNFEFIEQLVSSQRQRQEHCETDACRSCAAQNHQVVAFLTRPPVQGYQLRLTTTYLTTQSPGWLYSVIEYPRNLDVGYIVKFTQYTSDSHRTKYKCSRLIHISTENSSAIQIIGIFLDFLFFIEIRGGLCNHAGIYTHA